MDNYSYGQVIPNKPINAVTLRVSEGKCVLIGGLAIIEHQEVSLRERSLLHYYLLFVVCYW